MQENDNFSIHLKTALKNMGRVGKALLKEKSIVLQGTKDLCLLTASFLPLFKKVCTSILQSPGELFKREDLLSPPVSPTEPNSEFMNPAWERQPFKLYRHLYLQLRNKLFFIIKHLPGLSNFEKKQIAFFFHFFFECIAPYHHVMADPLLLAQTKKTKGMNLLRGFSSLLEDYLTWQGYLIVSRVPADKYQIGKDIATTPGQIVFKNNLIELISYMPSSATSLGQPLLLVTSWINKYYILDIKKYYSFVQWLVQQGFHVYMISWRMPDMRCRDYGFDTYIEEGIFAAVHCLQSHYLHTKLHLAGYCMGGTLLATAVAALPELAQSRIASLSLFASLLDFTEAGDMRYLLGESQIAAFEKSMKKSGYWDAKKMATAFNLLYSEQYFWPFFRRQYLQGEDPKAQYLLAWLEDYTHTPEKLFQFYMKQLYRDNDLAKGRYIFSGKNILFSKLAMPVFVLGLQTDPLSPKEAVFESAKLFQNVEFVLGDEGHIVGMLSLPKQKKMGYLRGGMLEAASLSDWQRNATYQAGSWWHYWQAFLEKQSGAENNKATYPFQEQADYPPAPGEYVLMKAT